MFSSIRTVSSMMLYSNAPQIGANKNMCLYVYGIIWTNKSKTSQSQIQTVQLHLMFYSVQDNIPTRGKWPHRKHIASIHVLPTFSAETLTGWHWLFCLVGAPRGQHCPVMPCPCFLVIILNSPTSWSFIFMFFKHYYPRLWELPANIIWRLYQLKERITVY